MKIAAVSIALLSASKSVDARIGSKAAVPFFKLIQDDGICKAETDAAIDKCTQVKADKCGACFDNAKQDDYGFDQDKMCVTLPACVKDECKGCQHEVKEAFNCHLKPHEATVCAADFAATLGSNFLQGKHDENCKKESAKAEEKCSKACEQCFENATEKDYSKDEATGCINLPSCVKGACSGCESEMDAVFTCHGVTVCAAKGASFDFAAAIGSNFLQGKDDEECKAEADAATAKCTQVKADKCGECFENATKEDYGFDEAKKCVTMPACVKDACKGCQHEVKEAFNCGMKAGGLDATACVAVEAVSAVF